MTKRDENLPHACKQRDNHLCQKCFRQDGLQAHHIIALVDGGEDILENLITLCAGCHVEWDLFEVSEISFELWLHLPPVRLVMEQIFWPDNELNRTVGEMTVNQYRSFLYAVMRERRKQSKN